MSDLVVEPPVRSDSEPQLMPDSLRIRWSCSFAWRTAFAAASLVASHSDISMASGSVVEFFRWRRRASVFAVVRGRRRTKARGVASGYTGALEGEWRADIASPSPSPAAACIGIHVSRTRVSGCASAPTRARGPSDGRVPRTDQRMVDVGDDHKYRGSIVALFDK